MKAVRISEISAQQIVEEIGDLVHQNINLMDKQGYIIASNDHSRIGHFHHGAYRIIRDSLPEFYVDLELANRLPGLRQGINLPIEVDGKLEGVIGITGSYEEVIHYGQIVQRMAAILVKERIRLDEERLDNRVHSRFLEDWVLSGNPATRSGLYERGLALGIDIRLPRRCMVVCVRNLGFYIKSLEGQEFIEQVEAQVSSYMERYPDTIILRNTGRQILLVNKRAVLDMAVLAKMLKDHVRQALHVEILAGIDGEDPDLHTAYLQASRALQLASRYPGEIVRYRDLNMELIFDQIPLQEKKRYLKKLFSGWDRGKMLDCAQLLNAYFAAEGSLSAAAEALYIHKNTLQYRIRQLAETTGLDVRKPSNAPMLYVALQFIRELEEDNELAELV